MVVVVGEFVYGYYLFGFYFDSEQVYLVVLEGVGDIFWYVLVWSVWVQMLVEEYFGVVDVFDFVYDVLVYQQECDWG